MILSKYKPYLFLFFILVFLKYVFPYISPFICGYILAKFIYEIKPHQSFFIYFIIIIIFLFLFISIIYLIYINIKQFYLIFPSFIHLSLPSFLKQFHEPLFEFIQKLLPFLSNLLLILPKTISFICFTLFITFLFLFDIHAVGRLLQHFSLEYYQKCKQIQTLFFSTTRNMLKSMIILFMITWIECFISLFIIQNSHAFSLSFLIAIFDSMPLLGVGFILIPLSIVSALLHKPHALSYFFIYLMITFLRFFIEPKIVSKHLNIPFLLYFFMMYICSKLFGFIGFFYAPILSVLLVIGYKTSFRTHDN